MFLVRSLVLLSPAVAIGFREKGLRNRIGAVVLGGDLAVSPGGFLSAHLSQQGHVVLGSATACHCVLWQ